MEDTAKISIIVPVYNVEAYLPQCLDSLVNQTYDNLEIICVNDGSPDRSAEILQQYAAQYARVRVITQKNQGASVARNHGLAVAQGNYIMFVDGDDWIDLDTCQLAVETAEKHGADVVFWSYVREYGNESREKIMHMDNETVLYGDDAKDMLHRRQLGLLGEELAHPEYADSMVTVWGKLYSNQLLHQSGAEFVDLRKIGTSEDALFNLEALGEIQTAVYLKRCLYHYRKNNVTSVTTRYKSELSQQWDCLFDMMQEYIEKYHLSDEHRQALKNRISMSVVGLGLNIMGAPVSAEKKISMIKRVISAPRYREAVKTLELCYFPIHWKVFYLCAKWRNAVGVYALLGVIQKIIARG